MNAMTLLLKLYRQFRKLVTGSAFHLVDDYKIFQIQVTYAPGDSGLANVSARTPEEAVEKAVAACELFVDVHWTGLWHNPGETAWRTRAEYEDSSTPIDGDE